MSKKKRKLQNKSVAMFAFALSLIASRSVATISASANTLDINQDEYRLTDERNAGTGASAYTKLNANTYLATGKSYSTYNFINSLKRVNGFAAVANSVDSCHLEGTVAAKDLNRLDTFNTNAVANNTVAGSEFTCYLAEPPKDATLKIKAAPGTHYTLILDFTFEEKTWDNGNQKGFVANGVEYKIEDRNIDVSFVRAESGVTFTDLSGTLHDIAKEGDKLMGDKDAVYDAEAEVNGLESAVRAIQDGRAQAGETLIVNIHANDLQRYESRINELLSDNKGVQVIINVATNGVDNVYFGNGNGNWNSSFGKVVFNFGSFNGNINTNLLGGTVVAPYATVNISSNLNGGVVCDVLNQQNGEIHQVDNDLDFQVDDDEDDDTPTDTDADDEETPEGLSLIHN